MMNPLAFFSPYKLLIEVVVIGALFLGIAYEGHRFLIHEQEIGYQRAVAEYTVKLAAAEKAAHEKDIANAKQIQDAQNAATVRDNTIRALASAASASSNSLRDTISSISRGVPAATLDALRQSTVTLAAILGECQGRYQRMAETADRHSSDVKTLQDAWPK